MKTLTAIIPLLFAVTTQVAFAQAADKLRISQARDSRAKLESSMKDFLVVFDTHQDGDRARLGIPLASFAEGQLNVAYDLSGRNVMAQWNFAQTSVYGTRVNYRAYVGESGMVSLGVSSRF